jgi:hypothetical protein
MNSIPDCPHCGAIGDPLAGGQVLWKGGSGTPSDLARWECQLCGHTWATLVPLT